MGRFSDALDRSMETIKRPPPVPIGYYIMRVPKMPGAAEEMKPSKDGVVYEKLTVPVEIVAPYEVDEDELAEFTKDGAKVAGVPLRNDYLFHTTDEAKYESSLNRLKEFMAKLGIDADNGLLGERLAEVVNRQFIGEVKHRADPNDPEVIYAELGRVTAYE